MSESTLYLADTGPRGRGVFAGRAFQPGDLVERAPVVVVPHAQLVYLEKTTLSYYAYSWGPNWDDGAVAGGLGSFYNHSYAPNAEYVKQVDAGVIEYFALRAIAAGEEITLNYNGAPDDPLPIWFDGPRWGWFRPDGRRDDEHGP